VIQEVKPFLSPKNVRKGGRSCSEIRQRLAECNFGGLVLDQAQSRRSLDIVRGWRAVEEYYRENTLRRCWLALNLADLEEPLNQFQHTGIDSDELTNAQARTHAACATSIALIAAARMKSRSAPSSVANPAPVSLLNGGSITLV
jgi:hypothetical protein